MRRPLIPSTKRERIADGNGMSGRLFVRLIAARSPSWPGLSRPSTSSRGRILKTWLPGTSPGMTKLSDRALDEPELGAFAFRQFRNRLGDDDVLEVPGLLVLGERILAGEHFIEEEFVRSGRVLVNLEFLHARLLLRFGQKLLQQSGDRAFLARIDLPERGHDQTFVCTACVHWIRSCVGPIEFNWR